MTWCENGTAKRTEGLTLEFGCVLTFDFSKPEVPHA